MKKEYVAPSVTVVSIDNVYLKNGGSGKDTGRQQIDDHGSKPGRRGSEFWVPNGNKGHGF